MKPKRQWWEPSTRWETFKELFLNLDAVSDGTIVILVIMCMGIVGLAVLLL